MENESPYKSPEAEVAGGGAESGDLTRAFLGPKNTSYYLQKFDEIERGSSVSWHWPAFFVTLIWFGYRRMWGWFFGYWFLYSFIMYLVLVGLLLVNPLLALAAWVVGYFVLPPLFANKLYYNSAQKKIARAQMAGSDLHSQELEAARLGGTSVIALVLIPVLLVFVIGILAAVSIPAYQDYTIRAQVHEGLNLSGGAKAAVTGYIMDTDSVPFDNAEAGLSPANQIRGNYVESVAVSQGEITVTYGNQAHEILAGQQLYLVPNDVNGSIEWSCGSVEIADRHLPALCRR